MGLRAPRWGLGGRRCTGAGGPPVRTVPSGPAGLVVGHSPTTFLESGLWEQGVLSASGAAPGWWEPQFTEVGVLGVQHCLLTLGLSPNLWGGWWTK